MKARFSSAARKLTARRFGLGMTCFIGLSLMVTIAVLILEKNKTNTQPSSSVAPQPSPTGALARPQTIQDLLAMKPEELAQVDLARMNLICAQGLPGAEGLDLNRCLKTLDEWAALVRRQTDDQLLQFAANPAQFENSEAYFRMLSLITVLQRDCGVHYNPQRIRDVDFRRPEDLFIHGMIGSDNGGTCASMPMLYAAVARKIGWPVHIVLAKEHVFCRWDGTFNGRYERVNIEATNQGLNSDPDEYYRRWPHPISEEETKSGEFLKTLSPGEELAVCLSARAYCLEAHGRFKAAEEAYRSAARLYPQHGEYAALAGLCKRKQDRTTVDGRNLKEGPGRDPFAPAMPLPSGTNFDPYASRINADRFGVVLSPQVPMPGRRPSGRPGLPGYHSPYRVDPQGHVQPTGPSRP